MKGTEGRGRGGRPGREDAARAPADPIGDAAVVVMALDEGRAQAVMGRLDPDELRRLSRAMANLGQIDQDRVEQTIARFAGEVGRTGNLFGGLEATERLLRRMLPPGKADEILDEIRGPEGRTMWEKLANINPEVLAAYLKGEHPQTAAVILAKLPAQHAARVFALLPAEVGDDVAVRMVRMDSIQKPVLQKIEETLQREFITGVSRTYDRDPLAIVAEILNRSGKDQGERIIRHLETREPSAAGRIRRIMFTFEDLVRVDRQTFATLVQECPADRLPVALSGAGEELREMFLSSMSERAAAMLREEIETLPPQRRKAVEEAQGGIIEIAKRLADDGRIVILEEDEGESF